jgi:hypothetical protein
LAISISLGLMTTHELNADLLFEHDLDPIMLQLTS